MNFRYDKTTWSFAEALFSFSLSDQADFKSGNESSSACVGGRRKRRARVFEEYKKDLLRNLLFRDKNSPFCDVMTVCLCLVPNG